MVNLTLLKNLVPVEANVAKAGKQEGSLVGHEFTLSLGVENEAWQRNYTLPFQPEGIKVKFFEEDTSSVCVIWYNPELNISMFSYYVEHPHPMKVVRPADCERWANMGNAKFSGVPLVGEFEEILQSHFEDYVWTDCDTFSLRMQAAIDAAADCPVWIRHYHGVVHNSTMKDHLNAVQYPWVHGFLVDAVDLPTATGRQLSGPDIMHGEHYQMKQRNTSYLAGLVLDHFHMGQQIGALAKHFHRCANCDHRWRHKHRIKRSEVSFQYGPHLCRNCSEQPGIPYPDFWINQVVYAFIDGILSEAEMHRLIFPKQNQEWGEPNWRRVENLATAITKFESYVESIDFLQSDLLLKRLNKLRYLVKWENVPHHQAGKNLFSRIVGVDTEQTNEAASRLNSFMNTVEGYVSGMKDMTWLKYLVMGGVVLFGMAQLINWVQQLRVMQSQVEVAKKTIEMLSKMPDNSGLKYQMMDGETVTKVIDEIEETCSSDQATEGDEASIMTKIRNIFGIIGRWFIPSYSIGDFFKSSGVIVTGFAVALSKLKSGAVALDYVLEKAGKLLETLFSWMAGHSIKLTEKAKKKDDDMSRVIAAMVILRYYTSEDATGLASKPLQRKAFILAYRVCESFILTYSRSSDRVLTTLVGTATNVTSRCGPLFRATYNCEKPNRKYHPFSLYLSGLPGVGKTYFVSVLAQYLQKRLADEGYGHIPDEALFYSRNASDAYWSGYADQFLSYIDDMYQDRNVEDYKEIFTMIGDSPLFLNMADLGSKGRAFSSRFVVMSSNQSFPKPNSITEIEALWRRRDYLIQMRVNTKYHDRDGNINFQEHGEKDDFWVFLLMDPLKPAVNKPVMTITSRTEMLDFIYQKFLEKHQERYPSNEFPIVRRDNRDFMEGARLILPPQTVSELFPKARKDMWMIWPGTVDQDDLIADITENGGQVEWISPLSESQLFAEWASEFSIPTIMSKLKEKLKGGPVFDEATSGTFTAKEKATAVIVSGIAALLSAGVGYFLISSVMHWLYPVKEQSAAGKTVRTPPKVRLPMPTRVQLPAGAHHQMTPLLDENSAEIIALCMKNCYTVKAPTGKTLGQGIFVEGRIFLTNKHMMEEIRHFRVQHELVNVITPTVRYSVDLTKSKIYNIEDSDLSVVIPNNKSIPQHVKIMKHLFSEADDLNEQDVHYGYFVRVVQSVVETDFIPLRYTPNFTADGKLVPVWQSSCKTLDGECGFPAFVILGNKQLRLCGLHTFGNKGMNFSAAAAVFREYFALAPVEELCMEAQLVHQADFECMVKCEEPSQQIPDQLLVQGKLDMPLHMPSKTAYEKTYFYGKLGTPQTQPSILTMQQSIDRGTGEDPYLKALNKYTINPVDPSVYRNFPRITTEFAQFFTGLPFYSMYSRILSYHEALNGNALPYMNHLDLTTSSGYPYKLTVRKKGKHEYMEIVDDKIMLTSQAKELIEDWLLREEKAKKRERTPSLWYDCLKDELLPHEKIADSKTRIFVGGPLDHTLLCRQYTLGFIGHMMINQVKNFCGLGIAESQLNWHELAMQLKKKDVYICGDFSNWDKRLRAEFVMGACDIINKWYGDDTESQNVRDVLFDEIAHTLVIGRDAVYHTHQGNKSGCTPTSCLNCLSQLIMLRASWIDLMEEAGRRDLVPWDKFTEHCFPCTYGDDHVIGVTNEVKEIFNQVTLQNKFAEFGAIYTDPHKNAEMSKWVTFDEIRFLKRKFVEFQGFYLGVKELDDVLDILSYVRHGENDANVVMAVNSVVFELWKFGKEVYDEWTGKITSLWREAIKEGVYSNAFLIPTWEEMRQKWFDKMTNASSGVVSDDDALRIGGQAIAFGFM